MKNKKKIIVIIITIVALAIIIGLTYAVWSKNYIQPDKNTMIANCFDISYKEEKEITMTNIYPQRDEEGLTNEAYKVTIENKCEMPISYKVKLRLIESTLKDKYIKIGVGTNIVTLSEVPKEGELYLIREDILAWKGKRIIDIRSWMEENTPIEEGQNKSYRYKIEIEGTSYNGTKRYLAKEITSQNKVQEEVPDFSYGSMACADRECTTITPNGDGLFVSEDDDGTSYYFRGAVDNNNVKFAKKDWKIIRINGDGSIRLRYEGIAGKSQFNKEYIGFKYCGYTYDNEQHCTQDTPCISNYKTDTTAFANEYGGVNSTIKTTLETWYKENLADYDDQISLASYCNDTSISSSRNSGPLYRVRGIHQPNLKCPNPTEYNSEITHNYGGVYKLKIGIINVDELNMAGIGPDASHCSKNNYLSNITHMNELLTLSPYDAYGSGFLLTNYHGYVGDNRADDLSSFAPVINLKSDVTFTGSGTKDDPYVVN